MADVHPPNTIIFGLFPFNYVRPESMIVLPPGYLMITLILKDITGITGHQSGSSLIMGASSRGICV
jgi:hypothetical protein